MFQSRSLNLSSLVPDMLKHTRGAGGVQAGAGRFLHGVLSPSASDEIIEIKSPSKLWMFL